MDTTLYVSISHQVAKQRKLDLIANNIANINTTAFRKESVRFDEFVMKMKGANDPLGGKVSFVQDFGVVRDFTDGALLPTGNSLDVAIQGDGFMMVETANGEIRYTRNGHMKLNDVGELATSDGNRVLDDQGNPIVIGVTAGEISIAQDGTVSADAVRVSRIALMTFNQPQLLKKIGNSLYSTSEIATPSTTAVVKQGFVESSNVNGVEEVTKMIDVLRSYQSTAKLMDEYQQMRSRAIRRLSQVGPQS